MALSWRLAGGGRFWGALTFVFFQGSPVFYGSQHQPKETECPCGFFCASLSPGFISTCPSARSAGGWQAPTESGQPTAQGTATPGKLFSFPRLCRGAWHGAGRAPAAERPCASAALQTAQQPQRKRLSAPAVTATRQGTDRQTAPGQTQRSHHHHQLVGLSPARYFLRKNCIEKKQFQ